MVVLSYLGVFILGGTIGFIIASVFCAATKDDEVNYRE